MRRLLDLVELEDVVDILLVTTLVYTAVVWIRRTQAAFVAIGLFILAVLYVLAEAFDLQLTTAIFRSFFAISVVIIVVLFQEELRQLFERLGVWSVRRGRATSRRRSLPADILVETLTDLARQRVGALVVLPGTQPIARHVRGGLALDGLVSVPLLKSIFDPHSPGHDGAVIVEGDRVTRFAAHLPLSTNFRRPGRRGNAAQRRAGTRRAHRRALPGGVRGARRDLGGARRQAPPPRPIPRR